MSVCGYLKDLLENPGPNVSVIQRSPDGAKEVQSCKEGNKEMVGKVRQNLQRS